MHAIRVTSLVLIAAFSLLSLLPPKSSAEPSALQAIYLAHPLRQRYRLTALYDHTNPNGSLTRDNWIQAYTGAAVSDDPGDPDDQVCDWAGGWVCGYTDYDASLWNLRWDQDHAGASGGPGWLWYDSHGGYDLPCLNDTPVNAARQGTVQWSGLNDIYIQHGADYRTYYRHLSARSVNPGVSVHVGREIGRSGVGGSGAHLHFEVRRLSGGVWTYVDPYGWEQGNLWAGGEPFPMGYLDQNNTPHGPFQLDNTKIRDKWISEARSLGSPTEDEWEMPCLLAGIQATGYVQPFERGFIEYCGGGPAQAYYHYTTFLPRLIASEDANAWNATVYVRNVGSSSPARVSITFLTRDGRVLDSRLHTGLAANATWEVKVRDVLLGQFLSRGDSNPVFDGAAIVAADPDVAVVVEHEKSQEVTAYTGISTLNSASGWGQPGTTLYAPVSMYNPWGLTWKTTLYVQNTTGSQATMSIQYCWNDNPINCQNEADSTTLPPYGSRAYQPNEMPDGFVGSARIYNAGQPVAAVVTQEDNTPRASDYNTFAAGQTAIYLPSMMRHWPSCGGAPPYSDCWESSFTVQNIGAAATSVTIRYYNENGTYTDKGPLPLAAKATHLVVLWDPLYGPPGNPSDIWNGAVGLFAGQPLVAVANQQRQDILTHQSYSSSPGGGTTLYGPFAANSYARGSYTYVSCSHVQNLGGSQTYVTRWYYDWSGGLARQTSVYNIPAWGSYYFYLPDEPGGPPPSGFGGSVRITRSANYIHGIHNFARLLNGNKEHDYGASYNLVQR